MVMAEASRFHHWLRNRWKARLFRVWERPIYPPGKQPICPTGLPVAIYSDAMLGPWWCRVRGHELEYTKRRTVDRVKKTTTCLTCGRDWDSSPGEGHTGA